MKFLPQYNFPKTKFTRIRTFHDFIDWLYLDTYRSIKYFIQRGRRGYCDWDVGELSIFINIIIHNMIVEFNDMKNIGLLVENDDDGIKTRQIYKDIIDGLKAEYENSIDNNIHLAYGFSKEDYNKWIKKNISTEEIQNRLHESSQEEYYKLMKINKDKAKKAWKLISKYHDGIWT